MHRNRATKVTKRKVQPIGPSQLAAILEHIPDPRVRGWSSPPGPAFAKPSCSGSRSTAFRTEWRRTTTRAGLEHIRFHELRHYYASLLIRHGESVKTVQARLGHASASETLDTYSHLWPDSDERTRDAVDVALKDHVRTDDDRD